MAEETLISIERAHDRATIASYFRQFADRLEEDGSVTFSTDTDGVSLMVPETATFEVEVEVETETGTETETETEADEMRYEVEFEIEWSTSENAEPEGEVLQITGKSETEGNQETIAESVDEVEGSGEAIASDAETQVEHGGEEAGGESDAAQDEKGSQHADPDIDTDEDR